MSTSLQRLGKYRLQERVGGESGSGIAEVWKAFSPQLRRYVAIKILHADLKNDPRFISRFEREANAIASLHHPNIVQIHDYQVSRSGEGSTDSNTIGYLVMDYIDGSTLADYIGNTSRKKNFPSASVIVHLFASICAAIDYAHQKGVIHGDIKPANILLDTHTPYIAPDEDLYRPPRTVSQTASLSAVGEPIVTDFGITWLLGTPAGTLSRWGLVTPFYISPKQAMGYPGDVQSDIYSLGVMLYEICTGIPPFQGDSPSVIMMQHITATPTPPSEVNPEISPALSTVILRSLDKNPRMRFPSASALAAALSEVLGVPMPDILEAPSHAITSTNSLLEWEEPEDSESSQSTVAPSSPFIAPDAAAVDAKSGWSDELMPTSAASWQRSSTSPDWPPTPPPQSPTPAFPPAPTPSLLNVALGRLRRRRRGVLRDSHLALIALLILILIGTSVGTLFVLAHRNSPPIAAQQVGQVYFLSSGQLYLNNNQGINDEVQIDLHGIAAPHSGKTYYVWLLGDANASEIPWILLGKVSENQGDVHFLYKGDVVHSNLLADMSRFVITEEDANTTPNDPLLDQSTWRYYGEISQTPSPKDVNHFSMLDHIRHLLVQAPELDALRLSGGLSIWMMRNIEEITKWALNAKEAWETRNTVLMSRQLINILYYIDGECVQADFQGMSSYMPTTPENGTIARIAHFSLMNPCIQEQQEQANGLKQVFNHTPHDYVDHILFHLGGVVESPGATPAQHTLAVQLNTAINYVKGWLEQVRQDALRLCHMSDEQLIQLSAFGILSDMEVQARYAYAGQTDPSTAQVQEGATWIFDNMQRLASINVTPYPPQ